VLNAAPDTTGGHATGRDICRREIGLSLPQISWGFGGETTKSRGEARPRADERKVLRGTRSINLIKFLEAFRF
jgi:hypothetical protein